MKYFLALTIAAFTVPTFAQDLNTMKNQANAHIDKKMSTLQTAKSCVNSAQSMDKFKSCKYDMHEDMKVQKMEMMEQKKDQKESED